MTTPDPRKPRSTLKDIAHRTMLERGLEPDFSQAVMTELAAIKGPAASPSPTTRDLRGMIWCSIDNDDSRDLDQLTVAEALPGGSARVLVAIADVADLVRQGSALDAHARKNTTSVYTSGGIFPMLPERLSTDLTSLGFAQDRVSYVIEMQFDKDGGLTTSDVYAALVRNQAKLAYNSVAAWLEGQGPQPAPIGKVAGLDENIRLQHRIADQLRALRHKRGALSLQTIQPRPVFEGDILRDLLPDQSNTAKSLIEEFMVAANGVVARYMVARKIPCLRRVVRTPEKWAQIVALAAPWGTVLPKEPDGIALEGFLMSAMKADPAYFSDLSLSIIKLLGRGEYVMEYPGGSVAGHFGLAVADYAHSTAPNRRFPDLLVQRLLKAAISGSPLPYKNEELDELARHCTEQEEAAKKVERQLAKSAAAMLLSSRIGDKFDAVVTGVTDGGTWVRILRPPVEGKLDKGFDGRKVGDRLRVQLVYTDVDRGYIDFVSA